jgi:hypothetical protein
MSPFEPAREKLGVIRVVEVEVLYSVFQTMIAIRCDRRKNGFRIEPIMLAIGEVGGLVVGEPCSQHRGGAFLELPDWRDNGELLEYRDGDELLPVTMYGLNPWLQVARCVVTFSSLEFSRLYLPSAFAYYHRMQYLYERTRCRIEGVNRRFKNYYGFGL